MDKFSENMKEHIQKNMQIFYHTTQMQCSYIDEYGETLFFVGEEQNYCKKIKSHLKDDAPCNQSHLYASKQAEELGEAYIFFCPAGLVHITVAIRSNQIFEGAIVAGPFQMSEPDTAEVDQLIKTYAIPRTEKNVLTVYYNAIPVISTETARYCSQLLSVLGKDIMWEQSQRLYNRKVIFDEQRVISETIHELKELSDNVKNKENNPGNNAASFEQIDAVHDVNRSIALEKELNHRIIRGDETGAKAILNELLGQIFFEHLGNNKEIIAACIELIVLMSRAAIEGGARKDDVDKVTHPLYEQAFLSEDIEIICVLLLKVIEKLILLIFPVSVDHEEQLSVIKKAVQYMNENYRDPLTLEGVAHHVNLSTTYFSRLFSNEMKVTFIEYLSLIRVEQSKAYLSDTKYSLSEIALMMGFSDQSYFSKVFKKVQGITPGKFRKMYV